MEAESKRLWIVTLANIAVAGLLLVVLYSMMLALAVLAPEISGWPLYILLGIGLALSVTGLRFTKDVVSRASRRITFAVNGCVLAFDLMMVFGLAALYFGSTKERFLIPEGYRGDVYVVYSAQDGESLNETRWAVTYRIPKDGILRVRGPLKHNWTRTEYFYQLETGNLERIRNFWPSTIHPTPENLTNDRDMGVFFPRTGTSTDLAGCSTEFQLFYVGTKAHLLTTYKSLDIHRYLRSHPVGCITQAK
jgi:hypothetical protein